MLSTAPVGRRPVGGSMELLCRASWVADCWQWTSYASHTGDLTVNITLHRTNERTDIHCNHLLSLSADHRGLVRFVKQPTDYQGACSCDMTDDHVW